MATHAATLPTSNPSEFAGLSLLTGKFLSLRPCELDRLTSCRRLDDGVSLKPGMAGVDVSVSGCLGCWLPRLPEVGIKGDAKEGVEADSEACAPFPCIGIESGGKSEIVGHGAIMAPS